MNRDHNTALHLFSLDASNGAPQWIQLTPSLTSFSTRDGRGPFTIKSAANVIRASLLNGTSIRIDYNHAIDLAAKAGFPSPAAGWIEEIAEHGPNNEAGFWGRVKWTPAGARSIADGEYRYISPVLLSSKKDDELIAIGGAALTNDPALVMTGLFFNQETPVNRKALCDALGLPATSDDNAITAAIQKSGSDVKTKLASALGVPANGSDEDLMSAAKRVAAQASTLANVSRVLQAAGLSGELLDEPITAALCAKLKGSAAAPGGERASELQTQVDNLQKQLASLTSQFAGNTAAKEVEAAIAAGKLQPAQKDWAVDYCTREPDGFRKFIAAAPTIVSGGRMINEAAPGADGLTDAEAKLCSTLGIKPEDYKVTRAAHRTQTA